MQQRVVWTTFVRAAFLVILAASLPAWAALGGDISSIEADQVRMQGSRRMIPAESYTVHEIQTASGTLVREYVSSGGQVFAVTFRGPVIPDLRQLLGSYFDQYYRAVQAQRAAQPGRRPVVIEEPGLIVQIGGHTRAFAGRAYLPEMLPSGVAAEQIQ